MTSFKWAKFHRCVHHEGRVEILVTPRSERRCSSNSSARCLFSNEYPPWRLNHFFKCLGYTRKIQKRSTSERYLKEAFTGAIRFHFSSKVVFPCSYLPIVEINMNDMVLCLTKRFGQRKVKRYSSVQKTVKKLSQEKTFLICSDLLSAETAGFQTSSGLDHQSRCSNLLQRQN